MRNIVPFRFNRNSCLNITLMFAIVFSLLSAALPEHAFANSPSSVRTVLVIEAQGNVSIKKSDGTMSYKAYKNMSLTRGDTIVTGVDSYVLLKVADHQDEITLSENAILHISDLTNKGKSLITKFTMWSGSVWTSVQRLSNAEDRFEIDTPTATMSVRGTNWWQSVDPITGRTAMIVASGVIRATTATATENEETRRSLQESKFVYVYPAQQIVLDSRSQTDLRTKVETVNVGALVNNASPKVIEKIIQSAADIQQENEQLKELLLKNLNSGTQKPSDHANLLIKDAPDLQKVSSNIDNIVGNIAKQAIEAKKIEKAQIDKLIEETNKTIVDPSKKLDLIKVETIDRTAGLDPEVEKAKQAAANAEARFAEEQRQLIENQQRLAALLDKIEADKKAIDEANKLAAAEAAKRAEEQLKAQLDEAARKMFEENKLKNEQLQHPPVSSNPTTPTGSGGTGEDKEPAPNPDPIPNRPMAVVLKSATLQGDKVTANIFMQNFLSPNAVYAVEVRLLYEGDKLEYRGNGSVPKNNGSVFGAQPSSVEIIKEKAGSSGTELHYAAINDVNDSPDSSTGVIVDGEKLLVNIPLTLKNSDTNNLNVKMVYFKVTDKNGNTILDGSHLITAPVSVPVR